MRYSRPPQKGPVIPAASLTTDQDPDFWGHSKETSRSLVLDVDDVVNLLPAKLVQQKHLERKLCNLEEFYSFPYDYLKPVQQLFFLGETFHSGGFCRHSGELSADSSL